MKVADLMVSPVIVTQKNKSVEHVRGLLDRKHIHAVPVLSISGEIEGIVSVSDVAAERNNDHLVEAIMTTKTHVVSPNSGIKDAAKMMEKHHVHHLVVMDEGQVVGILSSMDFVKLYATG